MKKIMYQVFILLLVATFSLYSKKIIMKPKDTGAEKFKNKDWLNNNRWFKIIPIAEILKNNPQIAYQKVIDTIPFDAPVFSISPNFPHQGYFYELFILTIPHGKVQGERGYVFIDERLSDEMARGDRFECLEYIPKIDPSRIQKISGRVAVIAQHGSDTKFANYYHWMYEVLGRLSMLEIAGIEYDWLYVGYPKSFMKQMLELWGIDFSKIIEPSGDDFCVQADELIVPSLVINTSVGHIHAGNFQHPVTSQYVRDKLLAVAQAQKIDISAFSKRIFISRNDSYSQRKILNESEIFDLFKAKGFKSYELTKLSVLEQIMLFNNAEIVVSEQGTGLANILFCNPRTKIIELYQALIDNCFWWVSCMLNLDYMPVKTLNVDADYFADHRNRKFDLMMKACGYQTAVPLNLIKKIVEKLD